MFFMPISKSNSRAYGTCPFYDSSAVADSLRSLRCYEWHCSCYEQRHAYHQAHIFRPAFEIQKINIINKSLRREFFNHLLDSAILETHCNTFGLHFTISQGR